MVPVTWTGVDAPPVPAKRGFGVSLTCAGPPTIGHAISTQFSPPSLASRKDRWPKASPAIASNAGPVTNVHGAPAFTMKLPGLRPLKAPAASNSGKVMLSPCEAPPALALRTKNEAT